MKPTHRLALIAGAALLAGPAAANHSWNGYHWAGNGTSITIRVNTAITSQWTASVGKAISDWNKSTELTLSGPTAVSAGARRCNPIAGQILVCNYSYGQRGWLGIATIWLDAKGHIAQATTKLNDSYHNVAPYNRPEWRALVACQEIGHDFGLDHQDENFDNANLGTCMDYTSKPLGPPANTVPNAHDYSQLNTIYNHNDGYTSAKTSTNFGIRQVGRPVPQGLSGEDIGDSPADWGRAIRRDRRGRPDVFVRDFAGGERAITHVFWALEADVK
jgi:hypothetical protein